MKIEQIASEQEMLAVAAEILPVISSAGLVGLRGDLGAGKTTLVRGLLQAMGYQGNVKSPTYGLVETYTLLNDKIAPSEVAHFDLYRLSDPDELEFIGFADFINEQTLCLIEWPEKGGKWTAGLDFMIDIDFLPVGRRLTCHKL